MLFYRNGSSFVFPDFLLPRQIEVNSAKYQSTESYLINNHLFARFIQNQIGFIKESMGMASDNQIGIKGL